MREKSSDGSKTEGLIWLTMLIKYDLNGNATVLRSFSKPAKDSNVKGLIKKKEPKKTIKMDKNTENVSLF